MTGNIITYPYQRLINNLPLTKLMVTGEELKSMSPEEVAELQKKNCIFCHIASGKVPAKKVYEDEKVLAFLDINPAAPGHLLLIPKEHQAILPQIPDEDVAHMFRVSKKLSNMLLRSLQVKGTNIFVANGAVAGQKAPHFMIHIIPRSEGDGINLSLPENEATAGELDESRNKMLPRIRQVFGMPGGGESMEAEPAAPDEGGKRAEEHPAEERIETGHQDGNKGEVEKLDFDALKTLLEGK